MTAHLKKRNPKAGAANLHGEGLRGQVTAMMAQAEWPNGYSTLVRMGVS